MRAPRPIRPPPWPRWQRLAVSIAATYLDDCPFYGDGAYVEDRRELLRARYVDLLLAIGGVP